MLLQKLQASGLLPEGRVTRLVAKKCRGAFAKESHPDKQSPGVVNLKYNAAFSVTLETFNALIEVLGEEEASSGSVGPGSSYVQPQVIIGLNASGAEPGDGAQLLLLPILPTPREEPRFEEGGSRRVHSGGQPFCEEMVCE